MSTASGDTDNLGILCLLAFAPSKPGSMLTPADPIGLPL